MARAYFQHDNRPFEAHLEERKASSSAAFLLPHLRAGMRIIDVGCGPGTITFGLAERVAPGEVIGVDVQPTMVDRARELARDRGVANVRFESADAYELPFDDGSFDAALAHMVLMHIAEPTRALREIRRVLRPGAVLGVRDADLATTVRWPMTAEFERFLELRVRAHRFQGTDGQIGRQHRQLLLEAGFERADTRAVTFGGGSPEPIPGRAKWLLAQFEGISRLAMERGWIDQAGTDAIVADVKAWAERPDAVMFTVICESLGWAPA
jgi:SAM-dependent methyltransferase